MAYFLGVFWDPVTVYPVNVAVAQTRTTPAVSSSAIWWVRRAWCAGRAGAGNDPLPEIFLTYHSTEESAGAGADTADKAKKWS